MRPRLKSCPRHLVPWIVTHKHTDTHLVVKLCGTPSVAKCRVPGIGGRVSGLVATSAWGTGQHKHENRSCCITREICCLTPFRVTCVRFLAPESFFLKIFSLFLLRSLLLAHSHCYKCATKTVLSGRPSECNRETTLEPVKGFSWNLIVGSLTLILLTWRIGWAHNNARK